MRRSLELLRCADYRWTDLLERADVMSEGAVREETHGATYYGTTSVLLPFLSRGGAVPDHLARDVVLVASRDPHLRVRAVRIARREAQVRSVHPIGRISADVSVRHDVRGVRLDVEVEAPVDVARVGRRTRTR